MKEDSGHVSVYSWLIALENAGWTRGRGDLLAPQPPAAAFVKWCLWGGAADTQPRRNMASASHPLVWRQSTWPATQVCTFYAHWVRQVWTPLQAYRSQSQCPGHCLSQGSYDKIPQTTWLIKNWVYFSQAWITSWSWCQYGAHSSLVFISSHTH